MASRRRTSDLRLGEGVDEDAIDATASSLISAHACVVDRVRDDEVAALGQAFAHASARDATMDAFVLKRSSRVMPGLRGTPALFIGRGDGVAHRSVT